MSNRVQSRRRPLFTPDQPMSKAEKRVAAREAKVRLARARRRRQALTVSLAGLGVIALLVGGFFYFRGGDGGTDATASGAGASPSESAPAAFPPVPEGADPALNTKPVVTKGTGQVTELKTTTLIPGNGPAVAAGQTITVNYVGVSYATGEEFDSSWKRNEAYTTPIGAGRVIPGWDQGLIGVTVGSRVQLDIPEALAYPGGGGPSGALRFVVDVLAAQ